MEFKEELERERARRRRGRARMREWGSGRERALEAGASERASSQGGRDLLARPWERPE